MIYRHKNFTDLIAFLHMDIDNAETKEDVFYILLSMSGIIHTIARRLEKLMKDEKYSVMKEKIKNLFDVEDILEGIAKDLMKIT